MRIDWRNNAFMRAIDDKIEKMAIAHGRKIVATAKALAPVDTGALKNSIMYLYERKTRTLTISVGVPYWAYQEYGWYAGRPQPYIRPAIAAHGLNFLSPFKLGISGPMSLPPNYTPRPIQARIRPHIAMANKTYNRGAVKRTRVGAFSTDRANRALRDQQGRPHKTDLSHLHHLKKAWN